MAKLSFNKLSTVKSLPVKTCAMGEHIIEIEQYLPLAKKLQIIHNVIAFSGSGEEGFFNIVKLEAYYRIEVCKSYTNIAFTEKQLEDAAKVYDLLELNGVWQFVKEHIPSTELDYLWSNILALAKEITAYNNSVLGILQTLTDEGNGLGETMQNLLQQYTNNPELMKIAQTVGLER